MRPLTDGNGPAAAAPSNIASSAPTNATVGISSAAESDRAAWDDFISRTPGGSFYHRFGWKGLVEREFGHRTEYLVARRDGEICGVLPLVFLESRLFGRILCSVPFLNYGGPCVARPRSRARCP
jgi:CelD/BcsL family acetyltransferase involved in cellulose biosynthesis